MTFIEAAKAYSVCPTGEGGGDLGEFGYGEMEELEGSGAKYIAETVEDILKFI